MADSQITYTADGTTQIFGVPFPFLSRSHIAVTVAGVTATFTWDNDSTITITTPTVGNGDAVLLKRTTPSTTINVDYTDGSGLPANDLDQNSLQLLYICQELLDNTSDLTGAASSATAAASSAASAATSETNAAASAATAAAAADVYCGAASGVDTIVLTPSPVIASYETGKVYSYLSAGTNTVTGVTANISTQGALAVKKSGGSTLAIGDLPAAGAVVNILYDGTDFEFVNFDSTVDLTAPGPIGGTTPDAGTFTNLTGTTTVVTTIDIGSTIAVTGVLDEDAMGSDSNVKLATQQSIKAYVDSQVAASTTDFKVVTTTRDLTTATGTQAITGVGFQPDFVEIIANVDNSEFWSHGWHDGTDDYCVYRDTNQLSDIIDNNTSKCIVMSADDVGGVFANADVQSLDADGLTLSWTKTGTPSGTATLLIKCSKK